MNVPTQPRAEWQLVEAFIRSRAPQGRKLQILEAGCGRAWHFKMGDIPFELTGIDLDAAALEARKTLKKDLHHAFVGDLRTAQLESNRFDVVYSSFVLEHVPGAEKVMENFVRWARPGGAIVVRVPDRDSIQGFTTRLTPFWFHVWFYRLAMGQPNAGKPGFAPYPTVYDNVISRRGMQEFAQRHGLVLREELEHGDYKRGPLPLRLLIGAYAKTVQLLSFGRIHTRAANITFILEKPERSHATTREHAESRVAPAVAG
jgi:SAM-dependent methyltransferase